MLVWKCSLSKECFFLSQQKEFVGLSFPTISSVGPNGAIIHYRCVGAWMTPMCSSLVLLHLGVFEICDHSFFLFFSPEVHCPKPTEPSPWMKFTWSTLELSTCKQHKSSTREVYSGFGHHSGVSQSSPPCSSALMLYVFCTPLCLFSGSDGTTDVTRTMHFGTPSAFEKVRLFNQGCCGC